jgi:uncharacterized protein (TIGR00730 family)
MGVFVNFLSTGYNICNMTDDKRINLPESDINREPISQEEMRGATQERIYEISREFTQGFKFLEAYPQSVTVFGSARFVEGNPMYDKARVLAQKIVKDLGYSIVTGGGPGIMEAVSRGAKEAGGNAVGLTIRLPKEQVMNDYLTSHIDFYYFFSRKVCVAFSSEAFIFFPGGYGTLDEFFEIVTLLQTHKIPSIPVILVGSEYWNEMDSMIKKSLLERGTIDAHDLDIYKITDDEEEILKIIRKAPVQDFTPYNGLRVNPIEE